MQAEMSYWTMLGPFRMQEENDDKVQVWFED